LLRFFQQCSLEEIAATLAISLSAAKMRLYSYLEQFRAEYPQVVGVQAAAV
jgi:DNA-directed RNA polymerase specialized sigma24 family protein